MVIKTETKEKIMTWNDVGFCLQEPCQSHFRVVFGG
jgi:hypothetical protein